MTNNKRLLNGANVAFYKTGSSSPLETYIKPHCKTYTLLFNFPSVSSANGHDLIVIDSQTTALTPTNVSTIKSIVDSGVSVIVSSSVTRTNILFDHSYNRNQTGDRIQGAHLTNRHPTLDYRIASGDKSSHLLGGEDTCIGFAYNLNLGCFPLYFRSDVSESAITGVGYISQNKDAFLWFDLLGTNPNTAQPQSQVFIDDIISGALRAKWHGIFKDHSPKITENGISSPFISESGLSDNCIFVRGTGINSSLKPSVALNGVELLPAAVTTPAAGVSGLSVVIFNPDFTLRELPVFYDTSSTVTITNFINKLNTITTEPFAIVSINGVVTNSALDSKMQSLYAPSWKGVSYYNAPAKQYSYCCIAKGGMGVITDRTFFTDALEPPSECSTTVNSVNDFGVMGYGSPLIETTTISNGVVSGILAQLTGVSANQRIIITAMGSIPRLYAATNTHQYVRWEFRNGASVISTGNIEIKSADIKMKYTSSPVVPAGATHLFLYKEGPGILNFVSVYKGPMNAVTELPPKLSAFGVNCQSISNSIISASPYIPQTWKNFHSSSSNLLRNSSFIGSLNQPIHWGEEVLTQAAVRGYYTNQSTVSEMEVVFDKPIEVPYVVATWFYPVSGSGSGYSALGAAFKSSSESTLSAFLPAKGISSSTPRFNEYYPAGMARQWYLMYGFILPTSWNLTKCNEFISKTRHYFGVNVTDSNLSNVSGGVGLDLDISGHSPGYAAGYIQLPKSTNKLVVRFLDTYNQQITSAWVYPIVAPMTVASWSQSNLYSIGINA